MGPVTAKKLQQAGITRLTDVRTVDMQRLREVVGSLADWLRQLSHGEDPRPVEPERAAKSSSSENTYAQDLVDLDKIREEVARMARENAAWLARRLAARTVTLKVRYVVTVTRSHTLSRHTADAEVIFVGRRNFFRAPKRARAPCASSACACRV